MFEIKIKFTTKSNCLIGNQTESFSIGGVDQATTVDESGKPIVHGTAFKGAFRNIVRENEEKMPRTKEYIKKILNEILNKYKNIDLSQEENKRVRDSIENMIKKIETYHKQPKAEYIFGIEGINNMPRLFCSDFRVDIIDEIDEDSNYFIIETKNSLEEKNAEIISRPRTYRVVKPGISFSGILRFQNLYFSEDERELDEIKKELVEVLKNFNTGFYGIGNSKSRGYGEIQVKVLE